MYRVFVALLCFLLGQGALASEAVIMSGKCYDVEIIRPVLSNKNPFTICVDGEKVSSRIIFSNPESLQAVCYQSGKRKIEGSGEMNLILENGYCDNSNNYNADNLVCLSESEGVFRCKSTHGELMLKHIWNLK